MASPLWAKCLPVAPCNLGTGPSCCSGHTFLAAQEPQQPFEDGWLPAIGNKQRCWAPNLGILPGLAHPVTACMLA